MESIDSSFALVMQALLQQQQILEEMEAENQELHRQLTDLRAGIGISINILGQQFLLAGNELANIETLHMPTQIRSANVDRITDEVSPTASSLQEMLLNEFASAATTHMATWRDEEAETQIPAGEEEEKAALRRELTGSFLLE